MLKSSSKPKAFWAGQKKPNLVKTSWSSGCTISLHANTESKGPQQKVCMDTVEQTNQQYCTRQQTNRNWVSHATCSITTRFCFQNMYFSANKGLMLYFLVQENGHLSASPPLCALSPTTQNFLAVKAFGSSGVRSKRTTPFLSYFAGQGDTKG